MGNSTEPTTYIVIQNEGTGLLIQGKADWRDDRVDTVMWGDDRIDAVWGFENVVAMKGLALRSWSFAISMIAGGPSFSM